MNYKLKKVLKKTVLSICAIGFLSNSLYAEEIERISGNGISSKYKWHATGMLYFDKPLTTGAYVSENISKFKNFDIDGEFSNTFYGGYFLFEHNFYVLPQLKTELSSYSFEKISHSFEKQIDGSYLDNRHYSYLDTEEQNYIAYWETMRGHDMQLNLGLQYKILKGHLKHENLTTHDSNEIGEAYFEKYMPMVYINGRAQFAKGIEIADEVSIGIDKTERNFDNTLTLNYYTKSGIVMMAAYRYKRQDFDIEDITLTNNTHSLLLGLGYKY